MVGSEAVKTIPRPIAVRGLPDYHLWLRYDDGAEGTVDLSDLAGRGVFKAWSDPAFFKAVRLGPHGAIQWGPDIDVCPDALYMRLTGKTPEEVFPAIRSTHAHA